MKAVKNKNMLHLTHIRLQSFDSDYLKDEARRERRRKEKKRGERKEKKREKKRDCMESCSGRRHQNWASWSEAIQDERSESCI